MSHQTAVIRRHRSRPMHRWAVFSLVVLSVAFADRHSEAQVYSRATPRSVESSASVSTMPANSPSTMLAVPVGSPVMAGFPTMNEQVSNAGARRKPNKPLPPWVAKMPQAEEELEVIHHRSQLIIMHSRIVRWAVSDPSVIDILQFSPTEISVIGLALGTTHLHLWFEGEPTDSPLIYRAEVIRDPSLEDRRREDYGRLERQLRVLFPNSQVYLVPLTRRVIVKGQARDQEEAAQILDIVRAEWMARNSDLFNFNGNNGYGAYGGGVGGFDNFNNGSNGNNGNNGAGNNFLGNNNFIINMLEIPGESQVMIHVRIAQLDRSQLRRFGIDLNYLINNGRHAVAATLGGAPSTLSGIFENGEVQVLLDWLASNRTAKILAEPSITVLSGHAASFLSGGEFAVPTIVGIGGAQGTTTTFRGFGTSLIVTPIIIDKDLVRMRIVPEFSAINTSNTSGGVPGLNTRRATTTVQLREGQTIALAGLFAHQSSVEVTRIPFLGELPYIGPRLFNAKEANQNETELLILVTPEIVRPMEQDEVPPVPGHYVTHPNDYELYHYAMTEGAPDQGVYQLAPYGWGPGMGTEIGYWPHNPAIGPTLLPGPANGLHGGNMPGMGGGFSMPGAGDGTPSGGYTAPPPAPGVAPTPVPLPEPSVRHSPNSRNPMLSRSSAEEIAAPQRSWNPFQRKAGNHVQPAGYNSPRPNGGVPPAGDQATPQPTGRNR